MVTIPFNNERSLNNNKMLTIFGDDSKIYLKQSILRKNCYVIKIRVTGKMSENMKIIIIKNDYMDYQL